MRILIVDDEKWMRDSLVDLITRELRDCQVVGQAENGIDGLAQIRRYRPDVVLADIKMPGLNGIELMQSVLKEDTSPKFVFLSGYGLFEYAQNAVNLGASGYLLKPVEPQELFLAIEKIRQAILLEKPERIPQNAEDLLRDIFMERTVTGNKKFFADLFPSKDGQYIILAIKSEHLQLPGPAMLDAVHQVSAEYGIDPTPCRLQELSVYLLVSKINKIKLDSLAARFEGIFAASSIKCYGGISEPSSDLESLVDLYRQALYALDARKLLQNQHLICFGELPPKRQPRPVIDSELERQIEATIEWMDMEACQKVLRTVWTRLTQTNLSLEDLHYFCDYFYRFVYQTATKTGAEIIPYEEPDRVHAVIRDCDTLEEVKDCLSSYLHRVFQSVSSQNAVFNHNLSESIKKYIADHYMEDISLTSLSDAFHFHPKYISRIFKDEVGVNFIDFLSAYRLQIAKELLEKRRYHNRDIARIVGYHDPNYFAKVFKKMYGLSPNQFARSKR